MYTFAVTLLLGLALFKIVDLVEDLVPGLAKLHNALTVALGVVGVVALDYSLFEGFGVDVREAWMGTLLTGIVVAGTSSVWRTALHWLGAPEDDHPESGRPRRPLVSKAA